MILIIEYINENGSKLYFFSTKLLDIEFNNKNIVLKELFLTQIGSLDIITNSKELPIVTYTHGRQLCLISNNDKKFINVYEIITD